MPTTPKGMRHLGLLGGGILMVALCGCHGPQTLLDTQNLDRGLIIVLPGIDGRAPHNQAACQALAEAALGMAVEFYDWTSPLGPLFNQSAVQANRRRAAQLADRIAEYRRQHPHRPVVLIAHSGGTAIAAWAAEKLGPGETVDGIIMLASSLSPQYDLSTALAHTQRGITSFYSDNDAALLGTGTTLLGTMDGQHTESAGKVRFHQPPSGGPAVYDKLRQIAWQPKMADSGHDGGHFGYTAPKFVARYIAPLVASLRGPAGTAEAGPEPIPTEVASVVSGDSPR
jgi:pimeloyl-ACP methyl ester carboxylesterase